MRIVVALVMLLLCHGVLAEARIALVGVTDDMDLVGRWARDEGVTVNDARVARYFSAAGGNATVLAPRPGASPTDIASLMHQADAALIVVDAMQGPLPRHREYIILARQSRVPTVSILLANVDALHAAEPDDARDLLRMEERELRAVMDLYELNGRTALLFHDASDRSNAPRGSAGSLRKAASTIAGMGERRSGRGVAQPQRQARGQAYLLTDAEVNGRGATIGSATPMVLWSEGSTARVQVTATSPAVPGDVAEVAMVVSHGAFLGMAGSRFLLLSDDRVVGMGVLTDVRR